MSQPLPGLTLLAPLLEDWRRQLTAWARNGALSRAALEALQLSEEPEALRRLVERWGAGYLEDLPSVAALPASAMPSAAGAYAMATGTIYLNQAWLMGASREAALDLLTEELGHHLDGLLNSSDTPGDEGEMFAALLKGNGEISEGQRMKFLADYDHGLLQIEGKRFSVEYQEYPKNLSSFRFTELSDYANSSSCFISTGLINTGAGDDKITGDMMESYPSIPGIWGIDNSGTILMGEGRDSIIGRIRYNSLNPDFTPRLGDLYGIKNSGRIDTGIGDDTVEGEGLGQRTWGIYNTGTIDTSDGNDYVYGHVDSVSGSGTDYAGIVNGVDCTIVTGSGNDTIRGFGFKDGTGIRNDGLIDTGSGDDIVSVVRGGIKGSGSINLGEGSDIFEGYGSSTVRGGAGIDFLVLDFGSYYIKYAGGDSFRIYLNSGFNGNTNSFLSVDGFEFIGSIPIAPTLNGTSVSITYTNRLPVSVVTLSLQAPGIVTEDGANNLIYTFNRTGDISGSLNVNYTVAGTATLGTDYLGIAATPATKTVSFAAGSATATVTVDPTADTSIELNETVELTLAAGTGYSIGTIAPVIGTILNDDFPVITLAVSPLAGVTEDGTSNLVYTFSRTGDLSGTLSVNYTVGGSAALGTDYTGIAATPVTKTVSFAAGSATATVTVDPTADTAIELNETVELNLAAGTGYSIGTTAAVVGTILNVDTFSTIDSQGNTKLLRRGDGQAFVEVGSTRQQVTAPWGVSIGDDTTGFRMLAAETIAGTNTVLFRHNASNLLHTWSLNANWGWAASNGYTNPSSPEGWALESTFQIDANGDSIIGAPFSTIDSQGNTKLLRRGDGQAFVEVGSTRQQITAPWGFSIGDDKSTFRMLAAETIAGTNTVLFRHNPSNLLHTWSLNPNWGWQASNGYTNPASPEGWALESAFQIDANGDSIIGAPFSTIDSQGNTKLLRRGDGQAFVEIGSTRQQITAPWGVSVGDDKSTFRMLAAETIAGTNTVLFRHNASNLLHTWSLNANWGWQASNGYTNPASPEGWALESAFQIDANGDSIIGAPFSTIDSQGNTKLLRRGDGQAFVEIGSTRQQVTAPWGVSVGDDKSTFRMLAAETIAGTNTVLFRHNPSNLLHTWSLNANWGWAASNAYTDPASSAGRALLSQFGIN